MNLTTRLHSAIAAVCPVHGLSIGRRDDKETWRIDYAAEATDAQRAAAVAVVAAFDPSAPTAADVRAEASRRMQALVGARDAAHLAIIISNAQREASRLQSIRIGIPGVIAGRDWTTIEAQRAAVLWGADAAVEAIRAASNGMETSPPADYTSDFYWPPV